MPSEFQSSLFDDGSTASLLSVCTTKSLILILAGWILMCWLIETACSYLDLFRKFSDLYIKLQGCFSAKTQHVSKLLDYLHHGKSENKRVDF